MRLLGRQRSDDAGTASDSAGNRDSSAPNATSPCSRASALAASRALLAARADSAGGAVGFEHAAQPPEAVVHPGAQGTG